MITLSEVVNGSSRRHIHTRFRICRNDSNGFIANDVLLNWRVSNLFFGVFPCWTWDDSGDVDKKNWDSSLSISRRRRRLNATGSSVEVLPYIHCIIVLCNRLPVARLCAYFLEMHCLIIHEIVEIDVGLNETFLELQQLSFV